MAVRQFGHERGTQPFRALPRNQVTLQAVGEGSLAGINLFRPAVVLFPVMSRALGRNHIVSTSFGTITMLCFN